MYRWVALLALSILGAWAIHQAEQKAPHAGAKVLSSGLAGRPYLVRVVDEDAQTACWISDVGVDCMPLSWTCLGLSAEPRPAATLDNLR